MSITSILYFVCGCAAYIGMTTSIANRRGEFSELLNRHCDVDVEEPGMYTCQLEVHLSIGAVVIEVE